MRVGIAGLVACLSVVASAALAVVGAGESRPRSALVSASVGAGSFLVASRDLRDPNFRETVVLILDHDRESGAVGLVINRPSPVELFRIIPHVDGVERLEDQVFFGGPVEPTAIMLLVRSEQAPEEAATPVFDDVYRSSSQELLERLAMEHHPEESFRAYAGYAGWAPGQLEAEIAAGGWQVVPGSATAVFEDEPDSLWARMLKLATAEWARLRSPAVDAVVRAAP